MESTRWLWTSNGTINDPKNFAKKLDHNYTWIWKQEYYCPISRSHGIAPLPALISLEYHNPSIDQCDMEIEVEEAWMIWYKARPIIISTTKSSTSSPIVNQNQNKSPLVMKKWLTITHPTYHSMKVMIT